MTPITNKFRYDINALRAIAVVSVLLFHLKIPFFSGGFVGVDVFFVISGYLMTRIIFDQLDKDIFSIIHFYNRRIKRIIPALIAMIAIVTIIGFFFYLPVEYKENELKASTSLLFFSNIYFWQHSGYFDSSSDTNILLHTWSLSVEWQFYLIYPILLWGINKIFKSRSLIIKLMILSTFFMCGLSIFWTYRSATASFYLLPTRTWEMLVGGLAMLLEKKEFFKSKILLTGSYLTIFLSVLLLDKTLKWPGIFTLLPIFSTFFILVNYQNSYIIIKNRVVQFIGKISYSLYLWHWPLIVFAQYMGYQLNPNIIFAIIISSFLLAYLSYTFIESANIKNTYLILSLLALLTASTYSLSNDNSNYRFFKPETLEMANYSRIHKAERDKQFSQNCCFVENTNSSELNAFLKRDCLKIDSAKKNILLLGDSHAASLSSSLRTELALKSIKLLQATNTFYEIPVPFKNKNGSFCNSLYRYLYFDFLKKNKKNIDGIIFSYRFASHPNPDQVITPLLEVIQYVQSLKIPIIIIGQNNEYSIDYSDVAAKGLENNSDVSSFYENKWAERVNDSCKQKLKGYYIDIYYKDKIPKLSPNNDPFMFDNNHLSKYGADLAVQKIFSDSLFINFLKK